MKESIGNSGKAHSVKSYDLSHEGGRKIQNRRRRGKWEIGERKRIKRAAPSLGHLSSRKARNLTTFFKKEEIFKHLLRFREGDISRV